MKRKLLKVLLPLSIISMLTVGISYAAFHAEKRTTNVITIGDVDVKLIDIYSRPEAVAPGEVVDKIVTAENSGNNDEYVRIKLNKVWTDINGDEVRDLDPDLIEISFSNADKWINGNDGYYYYQEPLKPGEKAPNLLDSFKLALNYKPSNNEKIQGNIIVSAEGIQSDNFKPEETNGLITGWGDIDIVNSDDSKNNKYEVKDEDSNVYFQKDSNEFITIPGDDLFLNFKELMPGDNKIQNINVSNKNNKVIHLFMYASQTSEDKFSSEEEKEISDELIEACTMEINAKYTDGTSEIIYTGPVNGKGIELDMTEKNAIYLGKLKKGDEASLEVKLHVPEEWAKGGSVGMIDWIFTCAEEEVPNVIPDVPKPEPIIKTGDNNSDINVMVSSAIAVVSLGIMAVLLIKKKKN